MNLSKEDLDELLNELNRPAFDEMVKIIRSKRIETSDGYIKHARLSEDQDLQEQFHIMVTKTEEKLLRVFRDFHFTKEQLALLLIDEKPIYRKVAKIRLEELENES